jgi:hypothetical protein
MELMEAASRTRIPYSEFKSQEFSLLTLVAGVVPTYRLRYPLYFERLTALSHQLVQVLRRRSTLRETVEA